MGQLRFPHISAPITQRSRLRHGKWKHAELLVRSSGERGRGAEFTATPTRGDRWVRTTGIPQKAKQWEAQQSAEFGALIRAFAGGLNAWAAKNPGQLSAAAKNVLPLTAEDVYAHGLRIIHYDWLTSEQNVYRKAQEVVKRTSHGWRRAREREGQRL